MASPPAAETRRGEELPQAFGLLRFLSAALKVVALKAGRFGSNGLLRSTALFLKAGNKESQ